MNPEGCWVSEQDVEEMIALVLSQAPELEGALRHWLAAMRRISKLSLENLLCYDGGQITPWIYRRFVLPETSPWDLERECMRRWADAGPEVRLKLGNVRKAAAGAAERSAEAKIWRLLDPAWLGRRWPAA